LKVSQHFPTKPQIGKNPWVFLVFLSFLWGFSTFRLIGKKPWNKNLTKSPWILQKTTRIFVMGFRPGFRDVATRTHGFSLSISHQSEHLGGEASPWGSVVVQLSRDKRMVCFLMTFNVV